MTTELALFVERQVMLLIVNELFFVMLMRLSQGHQG